MKTKNYNFLFKGVKIDERTKEHINKRISSIEKLLKNILQVKIEIDLNKKGKFRVEITIKDSYNLYRSEEISESIEGSLDKTVDQIKNQIRKIKGKRKTLINRGSRSIKKNLAIDKSARF